MAGESIIRIILKGVDNASKAFKSASKSGGSFQKDLKAMAKTAAAASAGIAVVGVTMKKAFDLGREGAAIQQTDESFGFLMEKVGAAPDLFEQLTAASHGTLTEFELQSSTMKLLAGASGDLASQLANATPRLLEIAKASNKLNPSLGTTAFMYESIATGVKRAQPLILDNLGLTLKVGAANEAYAAALGKTVEELTAEEKSIAILNATLKAGDVLIDQVGGDTLAATDAFDQMNVSIKESVDQIKKALVPGLTSAAKAINLILTGGNKLDDLWIEHAKNVIASGASYKEFTEEMERANDVANSEMLPWGDEFLAFFESLGVEIPEAKDRMELYGNALFNVARETEDTTGATDELLEELFGGRTIVEEAITNQEALAENIKLSGNAARESDSRISAFLSSIDKDIGSPLKGLIEDLQFLIATEGKFVGVLDKIMTLLDPKSAGFDPDKALQLAKDTLAAFVDTNVELGNMSAEEGIETLEDVDFTAREARDAIAGTDGLTEALAGIDDIQLELDNLQHVKDVTEFILADLQSISGTEWAINTHIDWHGGNIPIPSPGAPAPPGGGPQPDSGGGGDVPVPIPIPPTPGPGPQQDFGGGITQIFQLDIDDRLDIEELAQRLGES